MAKFYDRVAFKTTTTGTGTVSVGDALTAAFFTPAEAGAEDSDSPIPYQILDGVNIEIGVGTYNTGTPPTFSRDTVYASKISGTAGTSKINLSGNAIVRFGPSAEELAAFSIFDGQYSSLSGAPTLGDAAALDVGADPGTVAAGDDSRFTTSESNARTASYTLVLSDAGKTVRMNVASANNLTVPPNSSVAFAVDTFINVEQYGAGQTTIAPGSGVTIRSRNGLKLAGQYAMGTLHKIGTNEWIAGGDLTT